MGCLYKLTFPTGKSYLCMTQKEDVSHRMRSHSINVKQNKQGRLYDAWREHGTPVVETLAYAEGDYLAELELDAILLYRTLYPDGYNNLLAKQTKGSGLQYHSCGRYSAMKKLPDQVQTALNEWAVQPTEPAINFVPYDREDDVALYAYPPAPVQPTAAGMKEAEEEAALLERADLRNHSFASRPEKIFGEVEIDSYFVTAGQRFRRIGMTDGIEVDADGKSIGRAMGFDPYTPVDEDVASIHPPVQPTEPR